MIGEKIKLDFDGSSVKRGLAGIMKGFSGLSKGIGRATRQVGIGVGREAGASIFGAIKDALTAVPGQINELALMEKQMQNLGVSTGITQKEFLSLAKAIEISTGQGFDMAKDQVLEISEMIGEAFAEQGTKRDALNLMDLYMGELQGKTILEQIDLISQKFQAHKKKMEALGKGSEAIFALEDFASNNKELIPFFLNYAESMEEGVAATEKLNKKLKESESNFQELRLAKQALDVKFKEFSLDVLQAFGENGLKGLSDTIRALDLSKLSKNLGEILGSVTGFLAKELDQINDLGVWGYLKKKFEDVKIWVSEAIGGGIEMGIKNTLRGMFGEGGALKGSMIETMIGKDAIQKLIAPQTKLPPGMSINGDSVTFDVSSVEDNTATTNVLLREMINSPTQSRFA